MSCCIVYLTLITKANIDGDIMYNFDCDVSKPHCSRYINDYSNVVFLICIFLRKDLIKFIQFYITHPTTPTCRWISVQYKFKLLLCSIASSHYHSSTRLHYSLADLFNQTISTSLGSIKPCCNYCMKTINTSIPNTVSNSVFMWNEQTSRLQNNAIRTLIHSTATLAF